MADVICKAKKWGSSIGIIIPRSVVETEGIIEGEDIKVEFKKTRSAEHIFGKWKDWKVDPQKLKDEARRGWD